MIVIVVAPDGRVLYCPVHPLHLPVRPGMGGLGQSMLDVEIGAGRFKGMTAEEYALSPHCFDVFGGPAVTRRVGEVGAVVRQHDVDLVGNRLGQVAEEVAGDATGRLLVQLDEGKLGRPVDGHQQIEPPLGRLHFGDVDMEEADRIGLELLPGALLTVDVRQPANAMALKAPVQGRARQMRDCRLQSIETVVERQKRVPSEGDDHSLFLDREHR